MKKVLLILIVLLGFFVRLLFLQKIPPALYTDEADFGYNAFSILKTGTDEHGARYPVSLRSFGDWKPALPTYLIIPSIIFFGLNEFSVRLPSVVLGTGTIIVLFSFLQEMLGNKKTKISLLAAFFLAVSPWHILQSRAALPMVSGSFLLIIAMYLFLKSRKNFALVFLSLFFFALTLYDYLSFFIVTPAVLLGMMYFCRSEFRVRLRYVSTAILISLVIFLAPLGYAFSHNPNVLFGRAKNLSVFNDQGIEGQYWEFAQRNKNTIVLKLFHNKYELYLLSIIRKFMAHLNPVYLFIKGDSSPPFEIPNTGIFYFLDALFISIGLIYGLKSSKKNTLLMIVFAAVSILPGALTFQAPASNRTFNALFPFIFIISVGAYRLNYSLKRNLGPAIITIVFAANIMYLFNQYYLRLPSMHAQWWNYGWKQVIAELDRPEYKNKQVIISDVNGMPYIYFLFYAKYNPLKFQASVRRNLAPDEFGFEHIQGFDKYLFDSRREWQSFYPPSNGNLILILPDWQSFGQKIHKAIYYPNGKLAYKIIVPE